MTIELFRSLAPQMKARTLKRHGVMLHVRREGPMDVVLYQLEGFYVEIFFEEGHEQDARFRSFASTHELDLYLSFIDISAVLELLK